MSAWRRQLTGLLELNLDGTIVSDAGLKYLSPLQALRKLSLSQTLVQGDGLDCLKDAEGLTEIAPGGSAHALALPGWSACKQ